jgi:hypothetical protein
MLLGAIVTGDLERRGGGRIDGLALPAGDA